MRRYFAAIADKKHIGQGWPLAFCSGNSISDYKDWYIETLYLKADQVPEVCNDSASFAQLVAGLLNCYYNEIETKGMDEKAVVRFGKPLAELNIPHPANPELPF